MLRPLGQPLPPSPSQPPVQGVPAVLTGQALEHPPLGRALP